VSKEPVNIDEVKVESVMSKDFIIINKSTPIREVRDIFLRTDFATLLIVDEKGRLTAVVAAFDFLKLFDVKGKIDYQELKEKPVGDFESVARWGAITIGPQDSLRKCIEHMSSFRTRYLPALDKGRKVVGLISINDIIKFLLPD
jgi:CBS-domain-containing membrane protein